jgi:hypothetical protein
MSQPSDRDQQNADKFIRLIEAFKSGKQIQRQTESHDWHDINLGEYMNNTAVIYRIKPTKTPK